MTEIIVRPRYGGKTDELIRMCAEQGGYIVCATFEEAQEVSRRARELGLLIPAPLTAEEWRRGEYHPPGVGKLYFDDLDRIISCLSRMPVIAVTWTGESPDG